MIAYCRSLPHSWSEYDEIAKNTPKGWGIHAAILDIDIGPLLQVQKLMDSVLFARAKGYMAPLTAAELELMNLTGDGNGFDMVTMPQAFAPEGADGEFLPAAGLCAQSGGATHRGGGRADRRDPGPHESQRANPRRARTRGGVLAAAYLITSDGSHSDSAGM